MNGIVKIHGKEYQTVAGRTQQFREAHPDKVIKAELLEAGETVRFMAQIGQYSETGEYQVLATGYAEEVRGSTNINTTSALENCETSAIGRALAAFGYIGESYASADEVANAIAQQKLGEALEPIIRSNKAVCNNMMSIMAIKDGIATFVQGGDSGRLSEAVEAFHELLDEDITDLRLAPTKGGIFTTEEIRVMKSNEWSAARKAYFGEKEAS